MKKTMTEYEIVHALRQDEYAGWSLEGARALTRYLLELEDDCGIELEFDPVAFRCEYSEYDSAMDVADQCLAPAQIEGWAEEWLDSNHDWERTEDGMVDVTEVGTFDDAIEAAKHLGWEDDAEEIATEWIKKNTTVIPVEGGGVIIQDW